MAITINMTKAVEIKKDMIRAERAPMLAQLDIEYMRAAEANDSAKMLEIAAKKAALRDATKDPAITSAQTPDELKAVVPAAFSS